MCNVATQQGETDGFSVGDHLSALQRHAGQDIVHAVIANNNIVQDLPEAWHSAPVLLRKDPHPALQTGVRLVEGDVVASENRYRHDPAKLAAMILRVYDERHMLVLPVAQPVKETPALATR